MLVEEELELKRVKDDKLPGMSVNWMELILMIWIKHLTMFSRQALKS